MCRAGGQGGVMDMACALACPRKVETATATFENAGATVPF